MLPEIEWEKKRKKGEKKKWKENLKRRKKKSSGKTSLLSVLASALTKADHLRIADCPFFFLQNPFYFPFRCHSILFSTPRDPCLLTNSLSHLQDVLFNILISPERCLHLPHSMSFVISLLDLFNNSRGWEYFLLSCLQVYTRRQKDGLFSSAFIVHYPCLLARDISWSNI